MVVLHDLFCVLLGVVLAGLLVGIPAHRSLRSYMFRCWSLSVFIWTIIAGLTIFHWSC
jgi:hypothetical protein